MAKPYDPAKDVHFIPRPAPVVTGGIKAMMTGNATEHQQKMVLDWIINQACGTYDQSWRPGASEGVRASDFASGRRCVGLAIVREINLIDKKSPIAPPSRGELKHG